MSVNMVYIEDDYKVYIFYIRRDYKIKTLAEAGWFGRVEKCDENAKNDVF